MSKFTVKDLGLEYRMRVGGMPISHYPDTGLIYGTPPIDNTYTKWGELSVEAYGYYDSDKVDYEGLIEGAEDECFETKEIANIGFKIIDLKQLGKPIAYTEDKLGCGPVLERGFKLDLATLYDSMDEESSEHSAMYNALISVISNSDIRTPITVFSKEENQFGHIDYTGYISQNLWDFRNPVIAFVEDVYIEKGFENRGILSEVFKQLRAIFLRNFNYDLVMLVGDTTILNNTIRTNVSSSYAKQILINAYNGDSEDNTKGSLYFNIYDNTDTWVLSSREEKSAENFNTVHFVVSFGDDDTVDCALHSDCEKSCCSGSCGEGCKNCCATGMRTEIYRYSDDVELIGTDFEDFVDSEE